MTIIQMDFSKVLIFADVGTVERKMGVFHSKNTVFIDQNSFNLEDELDRQLILELYQPTLVVYIDRKESVGQEEIILYLKQWCSTNDVTFKRCDHGKTRPCYCLLKRVFNDNVQAKITLLESGRKSDERIFI
ncbi:MAG: hypothetical protein Q8P11_00575 [bacterium]|nr:hypothetical protein [bacterium]